MVIPPGITSSWTRNPLKEYDSAGNFKFIDEESTGGIGFTGNYKLIDEEYTGGMGLDFAGNYKLIDEYSIGGKGFPDALCRNEKVFLKLNMKMSIK
jgi:hypothetical protein